MEADIKKVFRQLGRGEKTKFISENIEYARMKAIVEYARDYVFDVLDYCNREQIAEYLRERGYTVTKQADE